jgi:hypothetical protein
LLLYSSHLPLGIPNGPVIYFINSVASLRSALGNERSPDRDDSQRSVQPAQLRRSVGCQPIRVNEAHSGGSKQVAIMEVPLKKWSGKTRPWGSSCLVAATQGLGGELLAADETEPEAAAGGRGSELLAVGVS